MKSSLLIIAGLLNILHSCKQIQTAEKQAKSDYGIEISFFTPDSIKIVGDLYELNRKAATIILFHQGGSNAKGEYNPIIPKLIDQGFNVLAIDQRVGGQIYGNYNRTVANIPHNNFSYCDAYPDLEAALDFAVQAGFSGKMILWGSSYSATLVIKLAHQYPDKVHAVLAFSPASGGPMQPCRPDEYFPALKVPLVLLRPESEMEIESVKAQFDLARQHSHKVYIAKNGVHGSSMLVEERVEGNADDQWEVVKAFLSDFKNSP